jgi:hypothetical protein
MCSLATVARVVFHRTCNPREWMTVFAYGRRPRVSFRRIVCGKLRPVEYLTGTVESAATLCLECPPDEYRPDRVTVLLTGPR